MKQFSTIYTEEYEQQKMQDNCAEIFNILTSKQISDGNMIQNISITNGSNEVSHKLARMPLGWIVINKNANVNLWSSSMNGTFITLQSSGACTLSLWVF